jgi:hypothetical protein
MNRLLLEGSVPLYARLLILVGLVITFIPCSGSGTPEAVASHTQQATSTGVPTSPNPAATARSLLTNVPGWEFELIWQLLP